VIVYDNLVQGSDEWLEQRRGMVTASAVSQLVSARALTAAELPCPACGAGIDEACRSKARAGAVIKTFHPERAAAARDSGVTVVAPAANPESKTLAALLAAERITGWSDPAYISDDMLRGIDDEPVARGLYSRHYAPATEVGFMVEDRWGFQIGYSPDGLVGDDGLIEIKSRRAKAQLATILADEVPAENMAQLQCGLLVSGRDWIDYVSYCGGMPLWVKRVYPQAHWFAAIETTATLFEAAVTDMIGNYRRLIAHLHPTERRTELELTL
jgi:hypothetical protein